MNSIFDFQLSNEDTNEFVQYVNRFGGESRISFSGNKWEIKSLPQSQEGKQVSEILNIFNSMQCPQVFVNNDKVITVNKHMVDGMINFLPNNIHGNGKIENIIFLYKLFYISWFFKFPTIFYTYPGVSLMSSPAIKTYKIKKLNRFVFKRQIIRNKTIFEWTKKFTLDKNHINDKKLVVLDDEDTFNTKKGLNTYIVNKLHYLAHIMQFKVNQEPETFLSGNLVKPDIYISGNYKCTIQVKRKLIKFAMESKNHGSSSQSHYLTFQSFTEALASGLSKSIAIDAERICLFEFSIVKDKFEDKFVQVDYQIFDYSNKFNLFSLLALLLEEHFKRDACKVSEEDKADMLFALRQR
ncbi:uncharacterized protein KGF55_003895 [Candida pseudojiufengensis]|uniref:uncharacterized protein n=1 Tax=Candida pseudojiufengensis TaxID=497109 RepID=UPI0022255F6E|nr:uncharacterized protein KGF55_003895 [Candida pseudojiufengensis]KAI5961578.1 hypothetical protein KGF55_003895 [Candida pseudojiufengensis]